MTSSLASLREKIERQVPRLGRKPYSMQIISLALGLIERDYGCIEANRAIEDFGLDELGWTKVNVTPANGGRHEIEAMIEGQRTELHATLAEAVESSASQELERLEVAAVRVAAIARDIRHLRELNGGEGRN